MASFDDIWASTEASPEPVSNTDFGKIYDEAQTKQSASDETIGLANNLLDVFTFGAGDEALAAGAGLYNKLRYGIPYEQTYDLALADARAQGKQLQEDKPLANAAMQLTSGLMMPIPYVNKLFTSAPGIVNAGKNILAGTGLGALLAGAYGYGEGEGGVVNRLENIPEAASTGALTGGLLTGAVEGAQGAFKLAKPAYTYFADLFAPQVDLKARQVVDDTLSLATDKEVLKKALEEAPTGGFSKYMTTAEVADDAGLGALQKTLENTFPEAAGKSRQLDDAREALRQNILNKEQGVVTSNEQLGQTLQDALLNTQGIAKKAVSEAYAPTEELVGTVNLSPVKKIAFERIQEEANKGVFPSREVVQAVKNLNTLPVRADFSQLTAQRQHIGNLLGTYQSKLSKEPKDVTNIYVLKGIFGKLAEAEEVATQGFKGKTKTGIIKGFDPKSAEIIKNARNLRMEQSQTFEQGAVGDILQKDNYGKLTKQASDVFTRAITSPEDARQVVKALKAEAFGQGTPLKSENARWNLGSNLFNFIRNKSTSTTTEKLLPTSFSDNWAKFKDVAHEILDPSQIKAINKVEQDLLAQAKFSTKLNSATANNSITSQRLGTAGLVKDNIKKSIIQRTGFLGRIIDKLGAGNDKLIEAKVDETLIKFAFDRNYAKDYLGTPTPEKIERLGVVVMEDLSKWIAKTYGDPKLLNPIIQNQVSQDPIYNESQADTRLKKALILGKRNENTNSVYNDIFSKKKVNEPEAAATTQKADVGKSNIAAVESVIDQDPYLSTLYEVESGRNPLAKNPESSAKGGFQFINSTAKAVGLDDPFDLGKSLVAIKKLTDENRARFGDDPTLLYSAHYLGATVLNKVLKGLPLTEKEKKQVEYLNTKVLPKFNKIYRKKIGQVEV